MLQLTGKLFSWLTLSILAIMFLLPFAWMLSSALMTQVQIYSAPATWVPMPPSLENFNMALELLDLNTYIRNTLIVALLSTSGTLFISSLVGYALAFLPAPGQRAIFLLMLFTIIIPPTVTIVPQFMLLSNLGWVNSHLALILPPVFGSAIYILLFRQYYKSIPKELIDCAQLDGCNPIMTYARIAFPLARPLAVLVAVFAFIGAWNDFLAPLVYLNSQELYTISLGLSQFQSANQNQLHLLMPASVLTAAPVVLIFIFSQKWLDTGLIGDIKP